MTKYVLFKKETMIQGIPFGRMEMFSGAKPKPRPFGSEQTVWVSERDARTVAREAGAVFITSLADVEPSEPYCYPQKPNHLYFLEYAREEAELALGAAAAEEDDSKRMEIIGLAITRIEDALYSVLDRTYLNEETADHVRSESRNICATLIEADISWLNTVT